VSSQRFSNKPVNVEFVIVLDTHRHSKLSVYQLIEEIQSAEVDVLQNHPEYRVDKRKQVRLFEEAREH